MLQLSVALIPPATQLKHIRALDGIRGVAYLLVVGHHCFSTGLPTGLWPPFDRGLIALFSYGYLGVDLFFVLSGFLITSLLLQDRDGEHYYWNFYIKRAFRILPAFLAVIAVVKCLGMVDTRYAVISLFFVANLALPLHVDGSQGPFWSLSVEEQFYLLWPFVVRNCSTKLLRRTLLATILIEPIVRVLMVMGGHSVSYYTFTRCDGLAWGALLALQYTSGSVDEGGRRWGPRAATLVGLVLFTAATLLDPNNRWRTSLTLTACPLLFVSLLSFVINREFSVASKIFRLRILCFFGDISYASYLVHIYVIRAYDRIVGPLHAGLTAPFLIRACVCLAITTSICTASLYLLERPVIATRRRFLRKSSETSKSHGVHLSTS